LHQGKNDDVERGEIKNQIGNIYAVKGQYAKSTKYYLESLMELKDTNYFMTNGTYMNIGLNYLELNDSERALIYFEKSVENFEITSLADSNFAVLVCGNVANALIQGKQYHLVKDTIETGFRLSGKFAYNNAVLSSTMGRYYIDQHQFDSAFYYITRTDSLYNTVGDRGSIANTQNLYSRYYLAIKDYDQAINHAQISIQIADSSGFKIEQKASYELLVEIYDSLGRYDQVYVYLDSITSLEEIVFNPVELNNLNELLMGHDIDDAEAESRTMIDVLKKEDEVVQYERVTLWASFALIALIIVIPVQRYRSQRKLVEVQLQQTEIEKQSLEVQIDYKGDELAKFAEYLKNKNQFLEKLKTDLVLVKANNPKLDIRNITTTINQNLSTDNERQEFQMYIEQINQDFFFKLQQRFPKLTAKEKRLCSLLVLNLSSKAIAQVFSIEVGSVEKSRYRLRKKLGLAPEESLTQFLNTLN